MLTNAGIYLVNGAIPSSRMVLVLSAFEDSESILVMPLHQRTQGVGIPILIDNTLMYIGALNAFRLRTDELTAVVAVLDTDGIDLVAKGLSSAVYGELQKVSIPTAIMAPGYLDKRSADKDETTKPINQITAGRNKYSLEDYQYIVENYPANINEILVKYGLEDKRSIYRLKNYLQRRFKKSSNNEGVSEPAGERPGPEGE